MSVILAIDAAWTDSEPSGVAVVTSSGGRWRCIALAPSYEAFISLSNGSDVDWNAPRFNGGMPEINSLLDAASRLGGVHVDLVTIDMPVATVKITGRRQADDCISKEYGGRGCGTHTPSSMRPGKIGKYITEQFEAAGYSIATKTELPGRTMRLVEVYPHPALLTLLGSEYRIPYKVAKSLRYWPKTTTVQRIEKLLNEFQTIIGTLARIFGPIPLRLPQAVEVPSLATLKRYEDAIDALLCAWVGICYLEGKAIAFGDETSSIWCPLEKSQRH